MSELNENVFDLARFRSQKHSLTQDIQSSHSILKILPNTPLKVTGKELGSHIDNIKQSIQRINKLMEELRTISKPNN